MKPEDYRKYECRYYHDGKWWSVRITAKNWADAEARVAKLGRLHLDGEVICDIPGCAPFWMIRFIVWFRNVFTKPTPPTT